jgi:DNA polymerase zeta
VLLFYSKFILAYILRYGERVPYIVVSGNPKSKLMDLVQHPHAFLRKQHQFKIHGQYYITKQIIPTLNRVFNLIGIDVGKWYSEMPKDLRDYRYKLQLFV